MQNKCNSNIGGTSFATQVGVGAVTDKDGSPYPLTLGPVTNA